MKIRNVKESDLHEILDLERLIFNYDQLNMRSIRWMSSRANAQFKVITVHKKIIGYSLVLFKKNSTNARLYSIALHPSFHGKGYGKKLLINIFKTLAFSKHTSLRLEVKTSNHSAIELYKKMGFIVTGKKLAYYDDGSAALCLEKLL